MTWHLKDKELERKLIEFCPKFLDELNESAYVSVGYTKYVPVIFAREDPDGNLKKNTLFFWPDELEELDAYNPHDWNEYPKVTPPEGVPMRIETENGWGCKAIFNSRDSLRPWRTPWGDFYITDIQESVCRFRPWED